MFKNKPIVLVSSLMSLALIPTMVSCKKKFDIPNDLKERTNNNYGIFFNQKITDVKENTTSKQIYDELEKSKTLDEIQKILEKYSHINFDYIDNKNYAYSLNMAKTKYQRNTLDLVFDIRDKKSNITIQKTFTICDLKDYVDTDNYEQIGNLKFYSITTTFGSTMTSKDFISKFKEEMKDSRYEENGEEQLKFFRKYCLVDGELDKSKYEIDFIGKDNEYLNYLHDHGPTNIHLRLAIKNKETNEVKEYTFFVYNFNSKVESTPFTLSAKENAKVFTSLSLIEELKKDLSFKNLLNYFDLQELDDYLDFKYEIDPNGFQTYKLQDPDTGQDIDDDDLTKFTMTIKRIDRFDSKNFKTFHLTINWLNSVAYIGYLKLNYYNYKDVASDISFNISNVELKKELEKLEFNKLSEEKQIEKLVELLNSGFGKDDYKPASIVEKLKANYKMKLNTKNIKVSRSKVYLHTIIELEFEITNLQTNETKTTIFKIHGLNY